MGIIKKDKQTWWNWQTRRSKEPVSSRHTGSSPVVCTKNNQNRISQYHTILRYPVLIYYNSLIELLNLMEVLI